jgi:hypothetical protein
MTEPSPMTPDVRDAPAAAGGAGGTDPERQARIRREFILLAIFGGFGLIVLPFLVYFAGAETLGPYEGGLVTFLGKLYGDLLHLRPSALGLVFGPYVTVLGARLLTRPLRVARHSGKTRT